MSLPQRYPSNRSSSSNTEWPPGTESWDPIIMSPVVTHSKAHALSHNPSIDSSPTLNINNKGYFDDPPDGISHLDPSSSPSPLNSSTVELSLSHIKSEQHSDPEIRSLIEHPRKNSSDTHFVLNDDTISCIISTSIRIGARTIRRTRS